MSLLPSAIFPPTDYFPWAVLKLPYEDCMVVPTVLWVDMPGAWFLDRLAVVEALSPVLKF